MPRLELIHEQGGMAERRLRRRVEADEDEWKRRVLENHDLQFELKAIREQLGLPDERATIEKLDLLEEALEVLCDKYDLPSPWLGALFVWLHRGLSVTPWRIHLPPEVTYYHKHYDPSPALIILPDTDITNPFILNYIRAWQAGHVEPVPSPQPVPGDPRKRDWRPVLEWRKKHPGYSHAQIAKMIGYSPQTVRRKLAELEARSD